MTNSVVVVTTVSVNPPKKPPIMPRVTPISSATSVAPSATSSETCPPRNSRRNSSLPSGPSAPRRKNVCGVSAVGCG